MKELQRKLHPDWRFQSTFFHDAPIAILLPPTGATWNIVIRCFARTRVERSFFGLGAPKLRVDGDAVDTTCLLATRFSVANGGRPCVWYPGTRRVSEVFGGEVPIISGDAHMLLNACGGHRGGFIKEWFSAMRVQKRGEVNRDGSEARH
ncbi:hypothetical protein [Burkholderia gladioli]|uniref:hypothetical protein n=1 Tax=Burkholderia gladioli TaxID=28095 RepID=UPI000FD97D76|nr:hypothetical protein [Burkholderia gladioli]